MMPDNFYPALTVLGVSSVVFLWARRVDARPADPLNPRMLPWRTIQMAAGCIGFLTLLFLVNLFRTGAPPPRY